MTDLAIPGQISVRTGWQLSPPPVPASIKNLEADRDPHWVSYLAPFSPTSLRRAQSYIKYYIPIKSQSRNSIDQWVTPGWKDEGAANGAVWTNETIHFVIDNCLPTLNDLMSKSKTSELYNSIVKAGLVQRQARLEGKDDRIWGRGLTDSDLPPWIISTIAITTEVKRLLPKEGTKWLFMRVTTKSLLNNRMDYDIVLMDQNSELIALSHHLAQVVHVDSKKATSSL
jgi:Thioesterase-like superfamily